MPITFRPLVAGDLPTMHRWLNDPGVVRWWEDDDVTWPGVLRDYGATAGDPQDHYIALHQGVPLGWIQCYCLADEPEDYDFYAPLGLDLASTASIDYLIGDPAKRGRGLGSAMIDAFITEIGFARHPTWQRICVAPVQANEASWRTLAAVGFRRIGRLPSRFGDCRAMLLDRSADGEMDR